jgi:hypothetical protein
MNWRDDKMSLCTFKISVFVPDKMTYDSTVEDGDDDSRDAYIANLESEIQTIVEVTLNNAFGYKNEISASCDYIG